MSGKLTAESVLGMPAQVVAKVLNGGPTVSPGDSIQLVPSYSSTSLTLTATSSPLSASPLALFLTGSAASPSSSAPASDAVWGVIADDAARPVPSLPVAAESLAHQASGFDAVGTAPLDDVFASLTAA